MITTMNVLPPFALGLPEADFRCFDLYFEEQDPALTLHLEDDDLETANDIDDFADLLDSLSQDQATAILPSEDEACDLPLNLSDLLPLPEFSETELDDLLGPRLAVSDSSAEEEDVDMDSDEEHDVPAVGLATPFWANQAPIDPRCVIKTPIFKTLDPRIPSAYIPKIDNSFVGTCPRPASPVRVLAPPSPVDVKEAMPYVHEPSKCWVCRSNKSEERKRILHRFVEKRQCRNWKRGARYTARSHVASSRVREGGRFVTKCQWLAAN